MIPTFLLKFANLRTLLIALFIILFLSVAVLFKLWTKEKDGRKEAENQRNELGELYTHQTAKTQHYENDNGLLIAKVNQMSISLATLQAGSKTKDIGFVKEFKGPKKDLSNVESASKISAHINVMTIPKEAFDIPEGSKAFRYSLRDDFNMIEVTALDSPAIYIRVPIYTVVTWERAHKFIFKNWRYGKKIYSSEVTSPNKLVVIDSIQSFSIRKK